MLSSWSSHLTEPTFQRLIAMVLFTLLFTLDSILLTAIPAAILAIVTFIAAFYFAKKNGLLTSILYISGALVLFGLSVKLCLTFSPGNNVALYSVLIGNSLFWLLSGVTLKLIYFTISGALGITAIIVYSIVNMQISFLEKQYNLIIMKKIKGFIKKRC